MVRSTGNLSSVINDCSLSAELKAYKEEGEET